MGLCGYHHCSHGLGWRGGPHSTHCQTLGVQHRRGPACLGSLIGGLFPTPPSLKPGLRGRLDVVSSSNAPANDTPSFILRFRLACDQASAPRWETGGQRPLHPLSARSWTEFRVTFAMHGTKNQSLVFPFGSYSVLCTFAAGFRCSLFSIFQEVYGEVFDRDPKDASAPRSASVVELLIAVLLVPLAGVFLRTPLRRTVGCSDASHAGAEASEASVFVPAIAQQVQSPADTAAAETNEELVQQVVMDDSAQCSCVSCFSASSLAQYVFVRLRVLPLIEPQTRSWRLLNQS